MAANPFDQFDTAEANPFDQFDAPQQTTQTQPYQRQPASWGEVIQGAPYRAVAGLTDLIVNTPENIANLAKMGYGTAVTMAGHPELAPEVTAPTTPVTTALETTGAYGYPQIAGKQLTPAQRITDVALQSSLFGINPAQTFRQIPANMLVAGTAGGTGQAVTEATGSPTAGVLTSLAVGGATNLLRPQAQAAIERTAAEKAANVVKDKIWEDSRKAGFVVPKSAVEPTTITSIKERAVGKQALSQKAQLKNQEVTNDLVRNEFGLSKDTPLSEELFDNMRNEAGRAYEEVKNLPIQQIEVYNQNLGMNQPKQLIPSEIVDELRQSRADARDYWKQYKRNADPETQKKAITMDAKSADLESRLDQVVQAAGKPELATNLREARTKIAKIYAVENAFNPASQNVDPVMLGRMLDKNVPLTGNLRTIGDFSRRFPGYVKEGSKLTSPGADAADTVAAFFATLVRNPVAAGAALLRAPARSVMLSEPYQNMFVKPNYGPNSLISGAQNVLANTALSPNAFLTPASVNALRNQGQQ